MSFRKYWWLALPVIALAVPLFAWEDDEKPERRPEQEKRRDDGPRSDRPRPDGERRPPMPRGNDDFRGERRDNFDGPGSGPRREGQPPFPGNRPGGPDGQFQGPPRGPHDGPPPGGPMGPGNPQHGGPGPRNFEQLKQHDPEMFELETQDHEMERKTRELSQRFHDSPSDKRDALKKEIQESVTKHFEVRQQRRKLQLERMEKELTRMREELEARNKVREQVINRRVSELVGDRGELDF